MVQIIEQRDAALPDGNAAEFRVYLSPQNASRVLGYVMPYVASAGAAESARAHTAFEFGEPVEEAFLIALALCEERGVEYLWIHDPKGLFPKDKRPIRTASAGS